MAESSKVVSFHKAFFLKVISFWHMLCLRLCGKRIVFLLSPPASAASFTGVSEAVQLPATDPLVHHMETWLLGIWKAWLFPAAPISGELNSHSVLLLRFTAKFFTLVSFLSLPLSPFLN